MLNGRRGTRVNLLKCKTCFVTPLRKTFQWLPSHLEMNAKSLRWFRKPCVVWPQTPTLTSLIFSYSTTHSFCPDTQSSPCSSQSSSVFLPQDLCTSQLLFPYCPSLVYLHGLLLHFLEVLIQMFPSSFMATIYEIAIPCLTPQHFLLPFTAPGQWILLPHLRTRTIYTELTWKEW